jgi:sulfate adenylyltransferase subunit 2
VLGADLQRVLACAPVSRVAVDSRGSVRWRLFAHDRIGAADHVALFESLRAASRGRLHLTVPGAPALRRLAEVRAWEQQHAAQVTLHDDASLPAPPSAGADPLRPAPSGHGSPGISKMNLTHLQRLEAESIHIMREVVAEAANPVMLYSIGKDSAVMLHLAMKAFHPAKPPFPLLHVDTRWKFRDMYAFRDRMARELGLELLVHVNPEGVAKDINPFTHGSAIHTDIMKTEGLKQALDQHGFDAAFGGARRDEEKSRAKERVFSFRTAQHRWDPKSQRPELWHLYNARKHKGESMRVFPLSNWTELDIWQYIYLQNIPIVPLYYAAERPVVERDGVLIMVDDERMKLRAGEVPMMKKVRFRTLGCYPLTGAVESAATTLPEIIQEMLLTTTSERQGRVIDHDSAGSMEKKKQEGYF